MHMLSKFCTRCLPFILMLFALLYAVSSESAEVIGKITIVEGQVDILKEGKLPAIPAKAGATISVKDIIRTKSASKTEVVFNDGNILKIAQRSRIDINEYTADGQSKASLNLPRGKVEATVDKRITTRIAESPTANKFEIRTPVAVAGVRGTQYFTFHERGVTGILVKEGKVETYNPKFPAVKVQVTAGQITTVSENRPPQAPRPATDAEKKGHEKDTAPSEKPKDKAEDKPKNDKPKDDKPADNKPGDKPADKPKETAKAEGQPKSDQPAPNEPAAPPPPTTTTVSGPTPPAGLEPLAPPPPPPPMIDPTFITAPPPPPPTTTFIYIPPPPITETTTTTTTTTNSPTDFSGNIYGKFIYKPEGWTEGGTLDTSISGSYPYNSSTGSGNFSLTGYDNPNNYKLWGGTFNGTTNQNGAFSGLFGGTTPQSNAYEYFAAFYVEGSQIGFITSNLSGALSGTTLDGSGSNAWSKTMITSTSLSPTIDSISSNTTTNTFTFNEGAWYIDTGSGSIEFGSTDHWVSYKDINPNLTNGTYLSLWRDMAQGTDYRNASGTTSASGPLGHGYREAGLSYYEVGSASFEDNLSNKFKMGIDFDYINLDENNGGNPLGLTGTLKTNYTGTYYNTIEGYSDFSMAGVGTVNNSPLLYMGKVTDGDFSSFNTVGALLQKTTNVGATINGALGGTNSLWSPSTSFKAIGDFSGYSPDGERLWWSEMKGRSMSGATTTDGAFYLYTAGIIYGTDTNQMEGKSIGLYIKTDQSTGVITSSTFSGNLYYGIDMWKLTSSLTAEEKGSADSTTYLPGDIVDLTFTNAGSTPTALRFDSSTATQEEGMSGLIAHFSVGGSLNQGNLEGHAISIRYDADSELPWGIFYNNFGGTYATAPATSWTAKAGGSSYSYGDHDDNSGTAVQRWTDGYWLADVSGSAFSGGKFTGSVSGTFMGEHNKATLTGDMFGAYTTGGDPDTYTGTTLGTYEETDLKYVSYIETNLYYRDNATPPARTTDSTIKAFMGETETLWNASDSSIAVSLIGSHSPAQSYNHYWFQSINPTNFSKASDAAGRNSTYDASPGAYYGYLGGIDRYSSASIDGKLYANYIGPDGKAGILKGSFSGSTYTDIDMFDASGTIARTELKSTTTGWTPSTLPASWFNNSTYNVELFESAYEIYWQSNQPDDSWGGFAKSTDDMVTAINVQDDWTSRKDSNLKISILKDNGGNLLNFGIFQLESWGKYTPANASSKWVMGTDSYWDYGANDSTIDEIIIYETWGDTWANGKLTGKGNGAWADYGTSSTVIWHGDTVGTYNDSLYSFGAVSVGVGVETQAFLSMIADTATGGGKEKLYNLGFPTIEVGTPQKLTGDWTNGGVWLNVSVGGDTAATKTRFFAYNSGEFPKIWATDTVSGSYTGTPDTGWKAAISNDNTTLSNATLFGDFQIKRWESNKWLADIDFTGGGDSSIQGWFYGVAAGTYDASTLSGTAAGLAFPVTALTKINTSSLYTWDGQNRYSDSITITASNNQIKVFDGATNYTATIATGTYTSNTAIATAVKTALEAADSGTTYTVTYATSTNKFSITASVARNYLWSDANTTMEGVLGFTSTDSGMIDASISVTSNFSTGVPQGTLYGVMGGVSLWNLPIDSSNPFEFEFVGVHSGLNSSRHVWYQLIEPYNYLDGGSKTTTDGGSYYGWVGGMQSPISGTTAGPMEGMMYALYVDPDDNIGILRGKDDLSTGNSVQYNEYWSFHLDGYTSSIATDSGITASSFGTSSITSNSNISVATDASAYGVFWSSSAYSDSTANENILLNTTNSKFHTANITGQEWGIWRMETMGTYNTTTDGSPASPPTDYWTITYDIDAANASVIKKIETWGTKWSVSAGAGTDTLRAEHRGYWADITSTPQTGIYVGELKGTFNPTNFTWQAISMGVYMETNKLLAMACPSGTCNTTGSNLTAAQKALQYLNIPVVEVGRADFSGSGNNLTVSMSDVIFLANQSGQKATMWATGSVSGSYTAAPAINTPVTLNGTSGFTGSVDFTPKVWNTTDNKWMSTISGSGDLSGGSYTGTVIMKGAGAGTINQSNSTFSGTAAGTAK
ncbi:MAG TPA: hypothetical protein DHV16_02090 [Nitrospiraceae bacterium]|nr:hypothetical protein [Nitrospiraceae bacterium]